MPEQMHDLLLTVWQNVDNSETYLSTTSRCCYDTERSRVMNVWMLSLCCDSLQHYLALASVSCQPTCLFLLKHIHPVSLIVTLTFDYVSKRSLPWLKTIYTAYITFWRKNSTKTQKHQNKIEVSLQQLLEHLPVYKHFKKPFHTG